MEHELHDINNIIVGDEDIVTEEEHELHDINNIIVGDEDIVTEDGA